MSATGSAPNARGSTLESAPISRVGEHCRVVVDGLGVEPQHGSVFVAHPSPDEGGLAVSPGPSTRTILPRPVAYSWSSCGRSIVAAGAAGRANRARSLTPSTSEATERRSSAPPQVRAHSSEPTRCRDVVSTVPICDGVAAPESASCSEAMASAHRQCTDSGRCPQTGASNPQTHARNSQAIGTDAPQGMSFKMVPWSPEPFPRHASACCVGDANRELSSRKTTAVSWNALDGAPRWSSARTTCAVETAGSCRSRRWHAEAERDTDDRARRGADFVQATAESVDEAWSKLRRQAELADIRLADQAAVRRADMAAVQAS